jgi:hypothetical protein
MRCISRSVRVGREYPLFTRRNGSAPGDKSSVWRMIRGEGGVPPHDRRDGPSIPHQWRVAFCAGPGSHDGQPVARDAGTIRGVVGQGGRGRPTSSGRPAGGAGDGCVPGELPDSGRRGVGQQRVEAQDRDGAGADARLATRSDGGDVSVRGVEPVPRAGGVPEAWNPGLRGLRGGILPHSIGFGPPPGPRSASRWPRAGISRSIRPFASPRSCMRLALCGRRHDSMSRPAPSRARDGHGREHDRGRAERRSEPAGCWPGPAAPPAKEGGGPRAGKAALAGGRPCSGGYRWSISTQTSSCAALVCQEIDPRIKGKRKGCFSLTFPHRGLKSPGPGDPSAFG